MILCLILIIDGLTKSDNYMLNAIQRLKKTRDFCQRKLYLQFKKEQDFWKIFTKAIKNIKSLKTPIRDIMLDAEIKD